MSDTRVKHAPGITRATDSGERRHELGTNRNRLGPRVDFER